MSYRVAINGYGRIGQCVLRALYENGYRDALNIVAINELSDVDTIAHLTRYDTTHGRFHGEVRAVKSSHSGMSGLSAFNRLIVNDDEIAVLRAEHPLDLPWDQLDIDLVLECTGAFSDYPSASTHLSAGAKRVLLSQPGAPDMDRTIVYGINHDELKAQDRVVSNASCTTNCIVPVIKVLHEALGIKRGTTTTLHSAMNDQPTIDAYHHHDLRRTRSSMQNMVPVDTGLAKGIERLLPEMKGCFTAMAVRVPTINVSAIDLTIEVEKATDIDTVNEILKSASENGLSGVLGYTEEPLASSDFNHDRRSAIVDGSQTLVSGKRLVKVFTWFDNEWGFANRMLDVANTWLSK
ncbi:glyceraldehyde-3-phosphate dehydrogenase (phosphorylating) [Oleiphilus messinensis]|uniref:Glyceraldehyde-3-phosphate dehydrogenase n=1 Tax=Oleiphilus messinensis TaxID=141451 RepID=A0A1Y0I8T1_9GAMM|nr:type I glyceraldehyde-3-phosphate dehydrogenase [Oleiphilus messinensis]ARU55793.1 glyceraldehyde-3-phosphate dehydrogenase (phosphorylating) [Oleiphilus messinensis]